MSSRWPPLPWRTVGTSKITDNYELMEIGIIYSMNYELSTTNNGQLTNLKYY